MIKLYKMKSHRPKGRMCMSCINKFKDCSKLDFIHMPIIGKDHDGMAVVKCTEFKAGA